MAPRGRNSIEVAVTGEADFGRARRDAARDLAQIEKDAKDAADDIERAFDRVELNPELDTADIRQALDLAEQLDRMIVDLDIDADIEDIQQAEKIARSLRAFQGRVDLSVEGRDDLKDALGLAEKMDQIRQVKVQVQGQQDLQTAARLAEDLEQTRRVRVDVDDSDIRQIDDQLTAAGEAGADGIADAVGGIDFDNIGAVGLDQLTGALSAAGPWGAAAAGIGVLFGGELLDGFQQAMNARRGAAIRAIRSGLSDSELELAGGAAGDAWAGGFGESLPQLKDDADTVVNILGDIVDEADLSPIVAQSQVLAEVLGKDVAGSAELARRSIKLGLADDVQDAFDDMIGVTQEFGDTGLEALEVYEEFGPNFARFEVDGGRAVQFVAGAFRDGLIPTIDRAGESFEEFTTRVIDSDSADAIADLGLDFAQVQADVAKGGSAANDAMESVVRNLVEVEDASDQARLANVIFGTSFEQVNDKGELLRRMLQLLSDDTDAYAGKAQEATDSLEGLQSAWEQLGRDATEAGGFLGKSLQSGIDLTFGLNDSFDGLIPTVLDWVGATDDAADSAGRFADDGSFAANEATRFNDVLTNSATGAREFGDEAGYAADALDDVELSASELRAELEGLFGFAPDQLMRQIADAGDDLAESLAGVDASAVGVNGSIDISTEEGRRLQSQFERLSTAGINLEVAFQNGEISAAELRTGQALLRDEFDRVTGSSKLTRDQVEALRRKYVEVQGIGTVTTTLQTRINNANEFSTYLNQLNNIPRTVTTTVRTVRSGSGGSVTFRASGGATTGLTVVGEEGPELLDLGSDRAYVYNADETRRMISDAARSFGGRPGSSDLRRSIGEPARSLNIENLNVSDGRSIWRELADVEMLLLAAP